MCYIGISDVTAIRHQKPVIPSAVTTVTAIYHQKPIILVAVPNIAAFPHQMCPGLCNAVTLYPPVIYLFFNQNKQNFKYRL